MKFGKSDDLEAIDFALPPEAARNALLLADLPPGGACEVYLGCTGWSMPEWIGEVYPKGTKSKDFLRYYAEQFNSIEFNTTHYRIPDAGTVAKWYAESAADFHFCPKIPQSISHSRGLDAEGELTARFCKAMRGLREKLGCCFLQLPPTFGPESLPILARFLAQWPGDLRLAVEFRHAGIFADAGTLARAMHVLEQHGAGAVITDVAGRRDVLHLCLSSDFTLVRFVGNGLHPTDFQRADAWVRLLGDWAKRGLRRAYLFPHQPDNLLAPQMAAYFHQQLRTLPQVRTRGPQLPYPSEVPQADGQMSLF